MLFWILSVHNGDTDKHGLHRYILLFGNGELKSNMPKICDNL
jgi:hypothetical protein